MLNKHTMKKFFIIIAFLISFTSFANTIIIKGYVRDAAGTGVANHYVRITTDTVSSNANCFVTHYKITNNSGFYSDTMTCSSDIKKLHIYTESCSAILVNDIMVTGTVVESNFKICLPPLTQPTPPVTTMIIVKGYVRDSSGKGVPNRYVKIISDSALNTTGCYFAHYRVTNSAGFYADTFYCIAAIKKLSISTESCGILLTNTPPVANNIIESNFIICTPRVVAPPVTSYVIVKGYVRDSSGKAIANHAIKIGTDSTLGSACFVAHGKLTNTNGFYVDTITCISGIKYVIVATEACGKIVSNKVAVINAVAENNFIICVPSVVTLPPVPACTAYFIYTQQFVGVKFNSNVSITAPNDSIISRKWSFGDGDSAYRLVDPIHIYKRTGVYNVCLNIKTARGCESKICKTIVLNDSLPNFGGSILEPVKIIILYPNPAHEKLNTVVWNLNTTTPAELSIVDIYGQKKWSNKVTLVKGNNSFDMNVSMLANGPYFLKVSTAFGVVTRRFYKL